MKSKKINAGKKSKVASQGEDGEDKKIALKKNQYPKPGKKENQLNNQPEFIESNPNK